MVYKKFRELGYPTDQTQRTTLLKTLRIRSRPDTLSREEKRTTRRLLPAPASLVELRQSTQPMNPATNYRSPALTVDTDCHSIALSGPGNVHCAETESSDTFATPSSHDRNTDIFQNQNYGWELTGECSFLDLDEYPPGIFSTPIMPNAEVYNSTEKPVIHAGPLFQHGFNSATTLDEITTKTISTYFPTTLSSCTPSTTLPSNIALQAAFRGTTDQRIKNRARFNRSSTPDKRISSYSNTTHDSGYESGRNTPLAPVAENEFFQPRSLSEFKGLYRVPCQLLHEPQPLIRGYSVQSQSRYKEVPRCSICHYSGIHNLSWSLRYLKLELFKSELKLLGIDGHAAIYDVAAIDAAGNSALHYAAAAGGGFDHFDALIAAGVNPYHLNTAGQLFIHCLRPSFKKGGSKVFDVSNSEPARDLAMEGDLEVNLFVRDLIDLLNRFNTAGLFMWPDNEGKKALEILSLHITNSDIKMKIFQWVQTTTTMYIMI